MATIVKNCSVAQDQVSSRQPGRARSRLFSNTLLLVAPPPDPMAQRIMSATDIARNEACKSVCAAAAVVLRGIGNPIDFDMLEESLGQAFVALDGTNWKAGHRLLRVLGCKVLFRSGLLEAFVGVSLCAAHQARGFTTYEKRYDCGEKLERVFNKVLDQSTMRLYKKLLKDEPDGMIPEIHPNELVGWESLVKKGGDTTRYSDLLMMEECTACVEDLIAELSERHNLDENKLTDYVINTLCKSFRMNVAEFGDTYYPSKDSENVEWSNSETESDDMSGSSA